MAHFRAVYNAVFHQGIKGAQIGFLRWRALPGLPFFGPEPGMLLRQRVCMGSHAVGCGIDGIGAEKRGYTCFIRARQCVVVANIGAKKCAPGGSCGVIWQTGCTQVDGRAVGRKARCGI